MPKRETDLRRESRAPVTPMVQVTWQDSQGILRLARGRLLNISERGMRMQFPEPIALYTYVNFRILRSDFQGAGSVRYCTRSGMNYQIGLEFSGELRWTSFALPSSQETPGS